MKNGLRISPRSYEEKRIKNDHVWTIERLQEYEKTMKHTNMAKQVALPFASLCKGILVVQAAQLLNFHRETVSIYVQKFKQNSGR